MRVHSSGLNLDLNIIISRDFDILNPGIQICIIFEIISNKKPQWRTVINHSENKTNLSLINLIVASFTVLPSVATPCVITSIEVPYLGST
jgi:hypothetical protein